MKTKIKKKEHNEKRKGKGGKKEIKGKQRKANSSSPEALLYY